MFLLDLYQANQFFTSQTVYLFYLQQITVNKMTAINDDVQPLLSNQVNTRSQELFSFKDSDGKHYSVVNIDGSKWTTKQGWEIVPRTDAIEFQYYTIYQEYLDAYRSTLAQLVKTENSAETPTYKQRQALAFMNYRQNNKIYSRLGCIQFIFIMWTIILAVAIIGYLILLHHQGVY